MFAQNFIKLSAAVHDMSCCVRREKKLSDDAENNTDVAFAASKKKHTTVAVNLCTNHSFA